MSFPGYRTVTVGDVCIGAILYPDCGRSPSRWELRRHSLISRPSSRNPTTSGMSSPRYDGEQRWRCVNAPHLVALVRAGATFVDGLKVEREDTRDVA